MTTDYALIVGQRRLEAHRQLGKTTIPAFVLDLDKPLSAEFDENERRKALNPSERVNDCHVNEAACLSPPVRRADARQTRPETIRRLTTARQSQMYRG